MSILSLQSLIKKSLKLPSRYYLRRVIVGGILLMPIMSLADNHFSAWSDKTICRLVQAQQDNAEYQSEAKQRGLNCGGSGTKNSSTSSKKTVKALAGIDIENDPKLDFFKPPQRPDPINTLYHFGRQWMEADFNNDGFTDVLYIGAMVPNNSNRVGEDTGSECGSDTCTGNRPLPSLFLGNASDKLTYSPKLIIDNRKNSGMSLGRQLLVADYNNDNTLDFYVADHGLGTHNGVRDSYFLSQPNGTWLESSGTHLSHSNFQVFDHGGATGDIDNDGDMDIVITELNMQKHKTAFWCLMNDGTGFLKKRKCGGTGAAGLELADMDGDGDLDALVGAHEYANPAYNRYYTGIIWNNGKGYFSRKTALPQHKKKWGTIPEVSASDLDNDGDLDVVYSRAGVLYVGTAIQIIENLGNKKFKDHGIIPLVEAPDDFIPTTEGNEWNDFIENIMFRDFDEDGDNDIYLASSMSFKTDGMVLKNNGNFSFELLQPNVASRFIKGASKTEAENEAQRKKDIAQRKKTEALEFAAFMAERKAKVAAAKAKRIVEEAAKAAEANSVVDTEQSVEDEIAAFEAELAAELAEQ